MSLSISRGSPVLHPKSPRVMNSPATAFRISRTSQLCSSENLVPFALYTALPCSLDGRNSVDYYETSVTIGLSARRPSRVPFDVERIERHVGPSHIPLNRVALDRLPGGGYVLQKRNSTILTARPIDAVAVSVRVAPLEIEIQAILLWPYGAGLAGRHRKRLRVSPAFPTCSCPLQLSPSGKSDGPEVSLRTSPDCVRDSTSRTAAHTCHRTRLSSEDGFPTSAIDSAICFRLIPS